MSGENLVNMNFGGKECQITPYESPILPGLMPGYKQLPVSDSSKYLISALCEQLPTLASLEALSDNSYYIVKWPDGLPHDLAAFANGDGFMGMSRNRGRIDQYAHLYKAEPQVNLAVAYGFTAMSVATSQYYLDEINEKMTMISRSIDKILEFLYGDKKAELLSEISFIKYAYQNFSSMMEYSEQRVATIQSLQEAKKTAIKDIEFYLADLYSTVHEKDVNDIESVVDKSFQIKQCLDLAIQLYMTGNLLEVYYSQNYNPAYLQYIEHDVGNYISKCEKQMLGDFHALFTKVETFRKFGKKIAVTPLLDSINAAIEILEKSEENSLKVNLRNGLYSAEKASEYCVSTNGTVWLKSS